MKRFRMLGILAVLMLTAAPGTNGTAASSPVEANITLCMPADTTGAVADVAVTRNNFRPYNLNVSLQLFASGGDALNAVAAGQCDMANTSELPGLTLAARGAKVYLVADGLTTRKNIGIVGKTSIRSPQDFIGKAVAYQPASVGQVFFVSYVNYHKLDASRIKQINITAPDTLTVLLRGDADAVFIWNPWLTRGSKEVPGMHIIAYSGDNDIWVVTSSYYVGQRLQSDPALAARVFKGLIDAETWFNAHKAEGYKIVATWLKTTVPIVAEQASLFTYEIKCSATTRERVGKVNDMLAQRPQVKWTWTRFYSPRD